MIYRFIKRNETAVSEAEIQEVSKSLGVSPMIAQLLLIRGLAGEAASFLKPDIRNMFDPYLFRDMKKTVALIRRAVQEKHKICVYGDYDADGINAAVILYLTLKAMNADAMVYLPKRSQGYGLHAGAVDEIAAAGVSMLITVDCGISNVAEVERAKKAGLVVIVTDHHECPEILPAADAIINPKRKGETYPYTGLCGGGIAFKIATALIGKQAFELIDFAAVATIADIVPLLSENRIIVAKGLHKLNAAPSIGLDILLKQAGIVKKPLEAESVAYGIAPRVNAAGRLDDPKIAFSLLCGAESRPVLEGYAKKLCALNAKRQDMQEAIVEAGIQSAGLYQNDKILVMQDDSWDTGIVGLAASALVTRFSKPSILFGLRDELYVGSARSVSGVNIFSALSACRDLLEVYGGHEAAAGMTIKKENLSAFRSFMNSYMTENYSEDDFACKAVYDMEAQIADISAQMLHEMAGLKPFGCQNEKVKLLLRNVTVTEKSAIGKGKHCRLRLSQNGRSIGGVVFGTQAADVPCRMDALVSTQINDYNGAPEVIVEAISDLGTAL